MQELQAQWSRQARAPGAAAKKELKAIRLYGFCSQLAWLIVARFRSHVAPKHETERAREPIRALGGWLRRPCVRRSQKEALRRWAHCPATRKAGPGGRLGLAGRQRVRAGFQCFSRASAAGLGVLAWRKLACRQEVWRCCRVGCAALARLTGRGAWVGATREAA